MDTLTRYHFYITNDRDLTREQVVREANDLPGTYRELLGGPSRTVRQLVPQLPPPSWDDRELEDFFHELGVQTCGEMDLRLVERREEALVVEHAGERKTLPVELSDDIAMVLNRVLESVGHRWRLTRATSWPVERPIVVAVPAEHQAALDSLLSSKVEGPPTSRLLGWDDLSHDLDPVAAMVANARMLLARVPDGPELEVERVGEVGLRLSVGERMASWKWSDSDHPLLELLEVIGPLLPPPWEDSSFEAPLRTAPRRFPWCLFREVDADRDREGLGGWSRAYP